MRFHRRNILILLLLAMGFAWLWHSAPRHRADSAGISASILRVTYDPKAFNGVGLDDGGWRALIGFTNQGWSVIAQFGISTIEVRRGTEWVPWHSQLDGQELGRDWAPRFGFVSPNGWPWPTNLPAGKPARLRLWAVREPNHLLYFLNYHAGREIFHRSPRLTGYSSEWMTER